jgi:hypothetical protein
MKNINLIDCVGVRLQSAVTYSYIGSRPCLVPILKLLKLDSLD